MPQTMKTKASSVARLQELTIVTPNRPGHLTRVLQAIARRGLVILAFDSSSGYDLNTVRLVLSDTRQGRKLLESLRFDVAESVVLGVRVVAAPGKLAELTAALSEKGINVDYAYGCSIEPGGDARVILHVSDLARAEGLLKKAARA